MSAPETDHFPELVGLLNSHALRKPHARGNSSERGWWQCGCGEEFAPTWKAEDEHCEHLASVIERAYVAPARRESHRQGYHTACDDMASGAYISGSSYRAIKASFTGQQIAKEAVEQYLRDGGDR